MTRIAAEYYLEALAEHGIANISHGAGPRAGLERRKVKGTEPLQRQFGDRFLPDNA